MVDLMVFSEDTVESKVAQDLIPFFEAVIEEVARHVPEKGYGYRDPECEQMCRGRAFILARRYADKRDNPGEALDAGAMLAFAWLHETANMTIINGELRSEN